MAQSNKTRVIRKSPLRTVQIELKSIVTLTHDSEVAPEVLRQQIIIKLRTVSSIIHKLLYSCAHRPNRRKRVDKKLERIRRAFNDNAAVDELNLRDAIMSALSGQAIHAERAATAALEAVPAAAVAN